MRYLTMLSELDEADQGSALGSHIGTTLLDLAALALGATRDGTQRAGMRGLRAARTQDIITRIASTFTDPALSPALIARSSVSPHATCSTCCRKPARRSRRACSNSACSAHVPC